MDLEIEKFIKCAAACDRAKIAPYMGSEVTHAFFGVGMLTKCEIRDLPDGPLFRIRFGDEVKEFNLEGFREGFLTKISPPPDGASNEEGSGPGGLEFEQAANAD